MIQDPVMYSKLLQVHAKLEEHAKALGQVHEKLEGHATALEKVHLKLDKSQPVGAFKFYIGAALVLVLAQVILLILSKFF